MKTTTEMQLVPITKLVPYVNNARTHSPEQINKLRSSLREFGFINPVIIDRDYGVIAGHGRILAAKEEGISEVPCVFANHLTEAQKKAYIIADNRMAMDAGWDEELLRVEIESLQAADFDPLLTGFDEKELSKLFDDGKDIQEDDFDVDAEHRVAVIRVLSGNSTIGNSSLYKTNNSIVNILRRISRDSSIKVLFVNKCDSIVLVFESPLREDEEYRRLLQAFIDTALSSLEAEGILAMASISLWKSFNEARRAAACWNVDDSRVHYFEKLGVYRFLSYENLRPELVIFYNETLKVLVDYDHDRDSELVHTLSLYFKCGGNLKRLAEEMGVHYNTVAYRIQRIKELAHVSFDNADQMLNLQIALKIYEVNFYR